MQHCPQCGMTLITKTIDGVDRQICIKDSCGYVFWNNPVPVVAALVRYSGVYIIARNVAWPNGIFSLIAGYLEHGENPDDAVIREVREELGLESRVTRFLGHYTFSEKNQLIMAYEVEASGKITKNHELAEIKKLTPDELLQYDFQPLYITESIIKDWKKSGD